MNNKILIFLTTLLFVFSTKVHSQSEDFITPNGIFDKVKDADGNEYWLKDLETGKGRPIGNGGGISSLPTISCSAGYFNLYMDQTWTLFQSTATQTLICQIFKDISSFISSPSK